MEGIDPYTHDQNGIIPIQCAVKNGHLEIVEYMIESEKFEIATKLNPYNMLHNKIKLYFHYGQSFGKTVYGMKASVDTIIASEISLDIKVHTILHEACSCKHLKMVEYLVKKCNCNPYENNTNDTLSPLEIACFNGNFSVIQYIFEHVTYHDRLQAEVMLLKILFPDFSKIN